MGKRAHLRTLDGNSKTQQTARKALPVLVRQAIVGQPLTYKRLAAEIDKHWRAMGPALGTIGRALEDLSMEWQEHIPPIEALVINKRHRIPGDGIAQFTPHPDEYLEGAVERKRDIAANLQSQVHRYGDWLKVLDDFGLPHPREGLPDLPRPEKVIKRTKGDGPDRRESEAHRRLKHYISRNPEAINLASSLGPGETEFLFYSGDQADVVFKGREWLAVEVKSAISNIGDIVRGLFQVVKYEALLRATAQAEQQGCEIRSMLVLQSEFPRELEWLRNTLGAAVVDGVALPARSREVGQ